MIPFKVKNFALSAAFIAVLGMAGCNLFNPTEDVNIKSGDANALTYEGYLKFRNNEYTQASIYFNKAIQADSSHSEAWYGLAKAKLNIQQINTFELLKYVNVRADGTEKLALLDMEESTAQKYEAGIDTVVTLLQDFIQRDTLGQMDGVISFKTISESYMLLNMVKTMLVLRNATKSISGCTTKNPQTGKFDCDIGAVLNNLKKDKTGESTAALHEVFRTCESNPATMSSVAGQAVPVFDEWITDAKQNDVAATICGALSDVTAPSDNGDDIDRAVNSVIAVTGKSDLFDDDGDGCIDEEIFDGMDNDGDGEIDEDLRDVSGEYKLDLETQSKNILAGRTEIKDRAVYASFGPNPKYENVDIDMNGKLCTGENCDEWEYIYATYSKREKNGPNYLLKFAKSIKFNPQGLPREQFIELKKNVAGDLSGKVYTLEDRKNLIGGCWVNYTEETFKQKLAQWREN